MLYLNNNISILIVNSHDDICIKKKTLWKIYFGGYFWKYLYLSYS